MRPRPAFDPGTCRLGSLALAAAMSLAAITAAAETGPPTLYRYTDAHYRVQHVFRAVEDEIVVRFDGAWSAEERAAFEATWSLVPAEEVLPDLGVGVYLVGGRTSIDVAKQIKASPPADPTHTVRVHLGLTESGAGRARLVPGQLMVQFGRGVSRARIDEILAREHATILESFWTPNYLRVGYGADEELFDVVARYNTFPEVLFASPDALGFDDALFVPNDPLYPQQWAYHNTGQLGGHVGADVDAELAWNVTRGDSLVLVAVIDEGVERLHEDLRANVLERPPGHDWTFDSADSTGNPTSVGYHGNMVASVACGVGSNGIGLTGMAPGSTILPLRVRLDSDFISQRVNAINYAVTWKGTFPNVIINCSWRSTVDDPGLRSAIDNAVAAGCMVVAACGNTGASQLEIPARYSNVFAVGSSTVCDTRAKFNDPGCPRDSFHGSNYGTGLDCLAPGVDIELCDLMGNPGRTTGNYAIYHGTSFACPLVAGIAALVWSVDPNLTRTQVENIIRISAEDQVGEPAEDTPGWDQYYGYGRVNAWKALLETGRIVGTVEGKVRDASEITKVPDASLAVTPGTGNTYAYRISNTFVDAQSPDTVHVSGIVTAHSTVDLEATVVEFGLVTKAQRDAAIPAHPSDLFDQGVFMRYALTDLGKQAAPADYTQLVGGGVGSTQEVDPVFTFDLKLAPNDVAGGIAYLSVNGGPYGTGHPYGVDNRTALGQSFPPENFAQAYLLASIHATSGTGGSVAFRDVRVETMKTGYGHGLSTAQVRVLDTGQLVSTDDAGHYSVVVDALTERKLIFTAPPYATPDTLSLNLAYADTLKFDTGIKHVPRAAVRGRFRAVSAVASLPDTSFMVTPGAPYAYKLSPVPIDAQAADTVHVTGTVTGYSVTDVQTTAIELGLISRAQRDSALAGGVPADMFDQAVFVRYTRGSTGREAAPGDFDAGLPSGSGPPQLVDPTFTFDLRLVPNDSTGGTASLSIDGGPFGPAVAYGTNNGTARGGSFPAEDLSEAYLLAQMHTSSGTGGSATFRNVRVEVIDPGYGEPLTGQVEVIGSSESTTADSQGWYLLDAPGQQNLLLRYTAPEAIADTIAVTLAHRDTLYQAMGLVRFPRGTLAGRVRSVSDVERVDDAALSVSPGTPHAYRIAAGSVNAQVADTVYVTGTIVGFDVNDVDTTVAEIGLITAAEKDSALVELGNPSAMFDQGVFARISRSPSGIVVAPGDYDAAFPGGVGDGMSVGSSFTFELRLVPGDLAGGTAQLAVNGGAYGPAFPYGVNNGDLLGGDYPPESFVQAYLVAQVRSSAGAGGTVTLRNVRVETVEPGDAGPIVATVKDIGSGTSVTCDAQGRYALLTTADSERHVIYSGVGVFPDTLDVRLAVDGVLDQPVGLVPTPRGSVSGRVTAGISGIAGVQVRYTQLGLAVADTSNGSGNYALGQAPVGFYDIRAQGAGYGPRRFRNFEIQADVVRTLDFDILAGFDDDLEFGEGAWTHASGDSEHVDEWHLSTQRNTTAGGTTSWKCGGPGDGDYAMNDYSILRMPPIRVQANQVLSFQHWIEAATVTQTIARHGGRVEVSTNGGATWAVLAPLGGYPYDTPASYSGPLGANTPLFSGSHGFQLAQFPLHGYVGDLLTVRLVFASDDTGTPGEGWYVDDIVVATNTSVGVEELAPETTGRVQLFANVPNPFNPVTRITYLLPASTRIRLQIYDVAGRLVARLADGVEGPGEHGVVWEGRDLSGREVGSGVYYYELRTGTERLTRRMLLLK